MSNDNKSRAPRQPEKKIGPFAGGIGVAIWLNEVTLKDGTQRAFRSITINPKRYFDQASNQWKDSTSYQQADLPGLIFSMQKALEYIYETRTPGQPDHEPGDANEDIGDRF